VKKLLWILLLAAVAYGTWMYLQKVKETTVQNRSRLSSPSEKALKDMNKEQGK
jgi:hypothetical protein